MCYNSLHFTMFTAAQNLTENPDVLFNLCLPRQNRNSWKSSWFRKVLVTSLRLSLLLLQCPSQILLFHCSACSASCLSLLSCDAHWLLSTTYIPADHAQNEAVARDGYFGCPSLCDYCHDVVYWLKCSCKSLHYAITCRSNPGKFYSLATGSS